MKTTLTIDQLIREFLSERDATEKSCRHYSIILHRFFTWCRGNGTTHDKITVTDVIKFKNHHRRINAYTTNNYLTVIKMFYRWCERKNYISHNFAQSVRAERIGTNHDRESFTTSQLSEMMSHINTSTYKGSRDMAIMLTLISTGMRAGELVNINIGDIEPYDERYQIRIIGKGRVRKDRIVMVSRYVVEAMSKYLDFRSDLELTSPLFASSRPGLPEHRLSVETIRIIVSDLKKKVGINKRYLSTHSIRHTFAVESVKNVGINETQMLLGHSATSTTERYVRSSTNDIIRKSNMGDIILAKIKRNEPPESKTNIAPHEAQKSETAVKFNRQFKAVNV